MSSGSESVYRCKRCGSPLSVTAESLAVGCSYCGELNILRPDLLREIYVIEPLPEDDIMNIVGGRGKGGGRRIHSLIELRKYFVPFYLVSASGKMDYEASVEVDFSYCKEEEVKKGGDSQPQYETRCWKRTRTVYVSGVYGPVFKKWPIIARKGVEAPSVNALGGYFAKKYEKLVNSIVPASSLEGKGTGHWKHMLAVEAGGNEAERMSLRCLYEILYDKTIKAIKDKAIQKAEYLEGPPPQGVTRTIESVTILEARLTPVEVSSESSPPILLPMYYLAYTENNGNYYRAFLAGWDGEPLIIEKPASRFGRFLYFLTAIFLASGIAAILSNYVTLPPISLSSLTSNVNTLIYIAAALAGVGILSDPLIARAVHPRRTTSKYLEYAPPCSFTGVSNRKALS